MLRSVLHQRWYNKLDPCGGDLLHCLVREFGRVLRVNFCQAFFKGVSTGFPVEAIMAMRTMVS